MKWFSRIVVALAACILLGFVWAQIQRGVMVQPPKGTNLDAFLTARPHPAQIRKFMHNGRVYFEVVGVNVVPLAVASGPPCYIFDETGVLVDWCADRGEASSYLVKWGGYSDQASISVEEAKRLVKVLEN